MTADFFSFSIACIELAKNKKIWRGTDKLVIEPKLQQSTAFWFSSQNFQENKQKVCAFNFYLSNINNDF